MQVLIVLDMLFTIAKDAQGIQKSFCVVGKRSELNSDQFTQGCVQLNLKTSQDNLPRQPVSIFTFPHTEDIWFVVLFFFFLMWSQNFSWFSFLSYSCLDPSILATPVDTRKSPLASWKSFISWVNKLMFLSLSSQASAPMMVTCSSLVTSFKFWQGMN